MKDPYYVFALSGTSSTGYSKQQYISFKTVFGVYTRTKLRAVMCGVLRLVASYTYVYSIFFVVRRVCFIDNFDLVRYDGGPY